ncbi:MAG: hypothetical protein L0K86_21870 [Actinomycetia bacterium]|nr:hypothetical protein [Actinomycetes bacterium]
MTTPPASPPRPTGWIVAAGVLGLVAVILAAVLIWQLLSDNDTVGESGESSAQAACDLIGQIPEDGFEMASEDEEDYPPNLARLGATEAVAMLATSQGDEYDDLYDAIRKARFVVNEQFDASSEDFVDALADARSACADVGF